VSFLSLNEDEKICSIGRSALLAMTFSLINPHAYLDAFVLIGGYSAKYSSLEQRLTLGLGAAVYSGVWFLVLSSLAAIVKPLLENQMRMRLISTLAGIFLIYLSGKLALDVLGGLPEISLIPWPRHAGELRLFTTVVI
jgi:L-lysine exporter family protein LysE/ArgO